MRLSNFLLSFLIPSLVIAADPADSTEMSRMPSGTGNEKQLYVNDQGYYASGEFLWWQVLSGPSSQYGFSKDFPTWNGLTYHAGSSSESYLPTARGGLAGNASRETYDWNPGFRLDFGYQFPYHDHWEVLGEYTWYQTRGTSSVALPQTPNNAIRATFPTRNTQGTTSVASITSRANLTYQVAELKLQKHFSPSRFLSLTVNADVQAGWFDQHWLITSSSFATPPQQTKNSLGWEFWGIGPGLGLDSKWYCNESWIVFFNANGYLLAGPHTASLKTLSQGGSANELFQKIRPSDTRFVPHSQLQFGLSWNYQFSKEDRVRFLQCYAAFEQNVLLNLVEAYRYYATGLDFPTDDVSVAVQGDPLQLYGLTLGFDLAF